MDDELRALERRARHDPTARRAYLRALERAGLSPETASFQRVGDLRLEQVLVGLHHESQEVHAGAFAPGGRLLMLATATHLHAWEVPDMRRDRGFGSVPFAEARAVAVSPDGRLVAALGQGSIGVWRLDDGAPVAEVALAEDDALGPFRDRAERLDFLDEERLVSSGHQDGALRVWTLGEAAPLLVVHQVSLDPDPDGGAPGRVWATLTSDRRALVSAHGSDGGLWLWDTATWDARGPFGGHPAAEEDDQAEWPPETLAITPDGRALTVAFEDSLLLTVDLETLAPLRSAYLEERGYPPNALFHPSAERLVALSNGNDLVELDASSFERLAERTSSDWVPIFGRDAGLVWTKDGLFRLAGLEPVERPAGHGEPVEAVAFPAPDLLLSGGASAPPLRWRLRRRQWRAEETATLPPQPEPVFQVVAGHGAPDLREALPGQRTWIQVAFAPAGRLSARAVLGCLQLCELGDEVAYHVTGPPDPLHVVAALRDDGLVARFAERTRLLWLSDGRAGGLGPGLALPAHETIEVLAFSADGACLASSGDGLATLWDVRSDAEGAGLDALWEHRFAPPTPGRLPYATDRPRVHVAASRALLATSTGAHLRVFAQDGERWSRELARPPHALRFAGDELHLVDGSGLRSFVARTGAPGATEFLPDLSSSEDEVQSVAVSPDGERVAVGTRLGALLVFTR